MKLRDVVGNFMKVAGVELNLGASGALSYCVCL